MSMIALAVFSEHDLLKQQGSVKTYWVDNEKTLVVEPVPAEKKLSPLEGRYYLKVFDKTRSSRII